MVDEVLSKLTFLIRLRLCIESSFLVWSKNSFYNLFSRCREQYHMPSVGGELVNDAVMSVFAALLWHSQELREIIPNYGNWFMQILPFFLLLPNSKEWMGLGHFVFFWIVTGCKPFLRKACIREISSLLTYALSVVNFLRRPSSTLFLSCNWW